MAVVQVIAVSQVHFASFDCSWVYNDSHVQESKVVHTELEERSKAEAASKRSCSQTCKDLKWT